MAIEVLWSTRRRRNRTGRPEGPFDEARVWCEYDTETGEILDVKMRTTPGLQLRARLENDDLTLLRDHTIEATEGTAEDTWRVPGMRQIVTRTDRHGSYPDSPFSCRMTSVRTGR